ncbi:hypothetical protein GIB67_035669 [Kingdonia uniflora]|uniref:Uncharacterized protein n=1 Tax=Kingdonia uniflora TaxID=39325 RepID=A0A7J7M8K9_9MAGN|nr:hypothetical protein GIB67_035669 [Kingdonia uniflora]
MARSQRICLAMVGRLAIKIAEVRKRIIGSFGYDAELLGRECELEGMKSEVEKNESMLDKVLEEETELKLVLEGLGLSRKKRVDSKSNKILKALPSSGTTESGEVTKDKRRRVEPSGESREKVVEGRSATVDDLKEVEKRARLAVLHGEEDTSKMVARLVKGIWLGIEEEKSDLKKANVKLENELARSRTNALKEVRQLKASHAVAIGQLKVETKANFDEVVEEHDRLGRHLMVKDYFEEEVDAIKADTYTEEEDEVKVEAVGMMDGLDGVSRQTVLDNQRDDAEIPDGSSDNAIREMSLKIKDQESGLVKERETSKALLSMKAELQHKLDTILIREKVMEGEIKAKESLMKRKEELLKDIPPREELNAEIQRHRARKNEYARLESRLEKVRVRITIMVIPDVSRSDLLKVIVTYFVEEVKRLKSERDTLFKTLSDKGHICGAKIDRGNCLGIMETQLGPRNAESIESGRAVVIHKLKV